MKSGKIKTAGRNKKGTDNPGEVSSPNTETLAAMAELKAGKGKKFESVAELFKSI